MKFSRRSVLHGTAAAFASPLLGGIGTGVLSERAAAQGTDWKHGLSLFGDVKYPAGFKNFEYVNPAAPQGGVVRLSGFGTFDNFNEVVALVKGNLAMGTGLITETLMTPSFDEVSTEYGLLADGVRHAEDHSWVIYRVSDKAKWHDGKPVTAEDVIFSFNVLKENRPDLAAYYRHVTKAEKTGEREVTFTFDGPGNRELPHIVGQLTIFPKHWWEGTDKSGNKRDITATTLEPPLSSGPYRIKEFTPGRSIVYEKVADYWGKDLNVNIGTNNFERIRYEYFRDSTVALEAFKGDQIDWRTETSAKDWATSYDFPAVREKKVVREEFPQNSSGVMQAFAFNIRRDKFKDARLRQAFNYAFDFEEMNRQLFYGQYKRINSYFFGTELASSGVPQGMELEILETVRADVPPDLFTKPYANPVNGDPTAVRNNLRQALTLLREAGYEIKDTKLVNAKTGAPFSVEVLLVQPAFERIALFYKPALQRLGIDVQVRTVDTSQYENRLRQWDYDIIVASWGESLSPGNEQREFWGSQAADRPGSRNYIGIKNPAVDKMIERVIFAKSREELVAATHALDRVLLWNSYVVPNWAYPFARTARWDRFGHPDNMPKYISPAFPTIWWWDKDKAAKVPQRS
ncbi:ABC transporter substrate-binding protein [Pseudolabrys taiwanensis]|uniref:ABC transporter substrate-binding protein n=1 Tax=Pseudolabrys taiwanensis TaxID=331696 RepID=A0A345ZY89_9HYPH|nr:extracellular solute-binding protein [Pseudolabrys taiwanensis]AXK81886.1 ABC transporter substrate-binding protein [Pseudolabrys taiwanensis]